MGAPRNLRPEELTEHHKKDLYFRVKVTKFKDYQGNFEHYKFLKLIPVQPTDTLYLDESLAVEGLFFRLLRISGGGRHPGWVVRGDYQPTNLEQLADIIRRPIEEFLEPLKRLILTNRIKLTEAKIDEETEAKAESENGQESPHTPDDLIQLWNMHASKMPKCKRLSYDEQEEAVKRLTEEPDLQYWEDCFVKANITPFLTGKNKRKWKATLGWLVSDPSRIYRVSEGYYDDTKQTEEQSEEINSELDGWS